MALILGSLTLDILTLLFIILIGCYIYFKWCLAYWKRKGIPYVKPTFPYGSMQNTAMRVSSFGEECRNFYKTYKARGCKHLGIYALAAPMYMPIDIELIKNIMQTDFDHFVDRGIYYNEVDDPLSANLFTLEGRKWKEIRVKLTQTFSSGKLKAMFPILARCGHQLKEAVDDACTNSSPIDIKDFAGRYTTNVIGSCAFGIDCDCFKENAPDFTGYGKRVFLPNLYENIRGFIGFIKPKLARRLGMCLLPQDAAIFFMKMIKETVNYREINGVTRKDLMQLLIDIKNNVKNERDEGIGLTFEELAAEAFAFFVAGYETSSATMTFCLYELACNLDIQQTVRKEIEEVLKEYNGEISYKALIKMKYMGQVIDETLRKYPALPTLNRRCVIPYRLPDTDIVLDEGTNVLIPVLGLHYDPKYFPEPEKFNPDRFSKENKNNIAPFTYMPFGEGPRNCIGLRFGLLKVKVGLAILLQNYTFSLSSKTKVPLKINPLGFTMAAEGDVWLNVEKIAPN